MQLETFRDMHRGFLRNRGKRPAKYHWPYAVATPLDPPDVAFFGAGTLIGGDLWVVEGFLRENPAGGPIVSRLTVESHRGDREVTGTIVRGLPIGEMRDLALRNLAPLAASRQIAHEAGLAHV